MTKAKTNPIQKIIFGSPGTGKSYKAMEIAKNELGIEDEKISERVIKTVFHPEYSYHDFMGKLLPQTEGNNIIYKFYPGHFLKILSMSYKNLLEGKSDNFLLVIDELNRGNAASIFGSVFQLLDRNDDGWSSYSVNISDLELKVILEEIGFSTTISNGQLLVQNPDSCSLMTINELFKLSNRNLMAKCLKISAKKTGENYNFNRVVKSLTQSSIELPSNLSIVATINTSDESIYYLDSAFKRRWDWEHIEAPYGNFDEEDGNVSELIAKTFIGTNKYKISIGELIVFINNFMRENSTSIRGIEDKQIGWWFIKIKSIDREEYDESFYYSLELIKDKLMFYLWDNVFARNKQPLKDLLKPEQLVTYSDFVKHTETFIDKIIDRYQ